MRNKLNPHINSLEAYYNIVKKYCSLRNEASSVYYTDEQFLEYVYERATTEFDNGVYYHSASEYRSSWANVIIDTAEFVEPFVDKEITDDEEFNSLLSLRYYSNEIPV